MEVKVGYKQAKTGLIPEDWKVIDMLDVCTLQRGFDITESSRKTGTIPVYSSSGLAYFHDKAMVQPPGVVTGRKGILGKVFLIDEPFWPHDTTLWVKDFKGNDSAYVALVLQNFHLERLDAATSVPTLNRNNLAGYSIPLPSSITEQCAIAAALSDVDALIRGLDQLIAKKRDIKQAAMQQLLTGRRRLPEFTVEWSYTLLGDVTEIKTGKRNGDESVEDGRYSFFVRSQTIEKIDSFSFDGEAILVPGEGGIGSIFHYINGKFDYHQRVYKISGFKPTVQGKFIYYCMVQLFNKHATRNSVKATVDSLRLPTFQSFELKIPSLQEQQAIAAVLSDMDAELAALEQRRNKTRDLKQGMMQELLTGRTRLV